MKKTLANIRILAALLIASAVFTACSNDDGAIIGEQPAQEQGPQVYTLTLQAGKADVAQTRALKLETMGDLTAYWADGDVVTVTKGTTSLGTLSVKKESISANGQTCTFSGTLTGSIAVNDVLTLTYHPMASLSAFGSQNGQLVSAAACDMAEATVTVASESSGVITIKETSAKFETKTAMLKITLQDTGGNDLNASSLTISAGGTEIFTLNSIVTSGFLYLALPSAERVATAKDLTTDALAVATVTFTATVGSDTYTATKTGYPFEAGKYYQSTVKMASATRVPANTPNIAQADCTFSPSNGKSTLSNANITTSMEYSADNGTTWTDVTSNGSIASLAAGTVQIRVKETVDNLASEAVSITVPEVLHINELVGPYTGDRLTCEYYAGETWQALVDRYDLIKVYSGRAAFGSDGFIYDESGSAVQVTALVDNTKTYEVQ